MLDVKALIDYNKEELEQILYNRDFEIAELCDLTTEQLRRIKKLEEKISFLQDHIKILESIKIKEKAKSGIWKAITAVIVGILGIFGISLMSKDK